MTFSDERRHIRPPFGRRYRAELLDSLLERRKQLRQLEREQPNARKVSWSEMLRALRHIHEQHKRKLIDLERIMDEQLAANVALIMESASASPEDRKRTETEIDLNMREALHLWSKEE